MILALTKEYQKSFSTFAFNFNSGAPLHLCLTAAQPWTASTAARNAGTENLASPPSQGLTMLGPVSAQLVDRRIIQVPGWDNLSVSKVNSSSPKQGKQILGLCCKEGPAVAPRGARARPPEEKASPGQSRGEGVGAADAPRSTCSPPLPLPPPPSPLSGAPAAADAWGAVECRGNWTRTPATVSCCIGPGAQRRLAVAAVGGGGRAARRATHPRPPVWSARRGITRAARVPRGG